MKIVVMNTSLLSFATLTVDGNGNTFTIKNGAEVLATAGQKIRFEGGFKVETGVKFKAKIANVTDNYINSSWRVTPTQPVRFSEVSPYLGRQYSFTKDTEEAGELLETVSVLVYPNPTATNLSFYLPGDAETSYQLQVEDLQGRTLIIENISAGEQSLDLSDLSEGIYVLQFIKDGKIIDTQKVIKR